MILLLTQCSELSVWSFVTFLRHLLSCYAASLLPFNLLDSSFSWFNWFIYWLIDLTIDCWILSLLFVYRCIDVYWMIECLID
jgi:hypothetical protein